MRRTRLATEGDRFLTNGPKSMQTTRTQRDFAANRPRSSNMTTLAAGVGFEPTGDLSAASGFQDRPVRPLRHPAVRPLSPRDGRAANSSRV